MDFNEQYNLHWKFFKDVNKEADEEFFINVTLRKLRNKIDKEELTIDFNLDGKAVTVEQYENERAKESFFFDKEYIKILEQKLELLKATKEQKPPQQDTSETQKEDFTFENNFDNIESKDVYEHFKAGLVDNQYIDEKTLRKFLNTAFNNYEDSNPPKNKIKMKNTSNAIGVIIRVFHEYYNKQLTKKEKKEKYVKLLTDYFTDFKYERVHRNFRNSRNEIGS